MLTVKTKVGLSKIDGVGLIADQFIPKGSIVWKYDPQFDICLDPKEVEKMPEVQRSLIVYFAYLSKESGKYVYSIDNTRFTNHSVDPNTAEDPQLSHGDEEVPTVALRDIQVGEEITIDYCHIDAADENSNEEYLKMVEVVG